MIKNFREIIHQLKSQVPIQDLISEYLTLKKSGRGFAAICPFHDDHNPSLQINPQKGIFKCFACGTGGDLITFYSLINKQKWSDAVSDLALKYGIKIEYGTESKTETQIKDKLFELNRFALDFYKEHLHSNDGTEALKYLKEERKLTNETIATYEMGFIQNKWDALYNYFTKEKQFPQELIIASGLFIVKENDSGYYDRFRNRIIFPIFNEQNKILAFGGRILPSAAHDNAKYINSPETLIFSKGHILYGLNFAKDEIKNQDCAILTEGYLDVISAHQHNLKNTVATLGTAVTQSQIRLLTKYTTSKKVYMCMDTDLAGKKAIEGVFKIMQEANEFSHVDIRVISKLPAKDLDESLKIKDKSEILKIIATSEKLQYFILDKITFDYLEIQNTNDEISKRYILDDLINLLSSTRDPMEQKEHIRYSSHKLNIDEEVLNLKIREFLKAKKHKTTLIKRYSKDEKEDRADSPFKMYSIERFKHAEMELLLLYINSFPNVGETRHKLSTLSFIDEKHILIKEYLDSLDDPGATPQEVVNKLIIEFNEYKHMMSVVSELALKLEGDLAELQNHYLKNKDKILNEASKGISWWITNKQKMKVLTDQLKECKNSEEETDVLSQILKLAKGQNLPNK
ncbi:MAG: DNA primase [Candidatus Melainabacteria bacterium]|nr:DNA primase [Candidatus Melainabacteria bacterium]